MNSDTPTQALQPEEHLFILDWGDLYAKLLYACVTPQGVQMIDGFVTESIKMSHGTPQDEDESIEAIRILIDQCQNKYDLNIQTLFVLVRSGGELAYPVPDARPYLDFLEKERQGYTPFSSAHLQHIPHHCDLFDAFESEFQAFRYAFALPSTMRERIQHSLLKAGCFVEGFLSLPRIGVKSRQHIRPGLILGIFQENSIVIASKGDDLPFYREFPFSLNLATEKICSRFKIPEDRGRRILRWITKTPDISEFDQAHPEDQTLFMSKEFSQVKNDIADELDKLTISIRQKMEESGVWDLGFDHLYLFGEGQQFYHHFTFLRDNLPFEPMSLPLAHQTSFAKGLNEQDFAPLIRLVDYSLQLRHGHRQSLIKDDTLTKLKKWSRRFLAR